MVVEDGSRRLEMSRLQGFAQGLHEVHFPATLKGRCVQNDSGRMTLRNREHDIPCDRALGTRERVSL